MVGSTSVLTKLLKYSHFANFVKTQFPFLAHKKRLALVSSEPPLLAFLRLYGCSVSFACYTFGSEPQRQHCRSISTSKPLSSPIPSDSRRKGLSFIHASAPRRSSVRLFRCSEDFSRRHRGSWANSSGVYSVSRGMSIGKRQIHSAHINPFHHHRYSL